jgi:hypothetical protein
MSLTIFGYVLTERLADTGAEPSPEYNLSPAVGVGWCYMRYVYTPHPRRDINDWSGIVVMAFWLVGLPIVGVVMGSLVGIWSAYLLGEVLPDDPAKKPGPNGF